MEGRVSVLEHSKSNSVTSSKNLRIIFIRTLQQINKLLSEANGAFAHATWLPVKSNLSPKPKGAEFRIPIENTASFDELLKMFEEEP
ncbi:hypothetical protein CDL15_Pgr016254 [Punica granatum]|uniref:Uncharacterized protein n=1 Tax=Punica granatum TaxID=22663 RepID=A0A218X1M1_PUNGR|nr:hypothetical protein CDL15_Pgr016254 [Punica granatum]